jgi:glycosyltransferase involved in cell wall biosynthesis
MKILQIMASKANGGAEIYSTDVMLSLHKEGIDQCVVMAKDAPRFDELQRAGIRMAPDILSAPFGFMQRWRMKRLIAKEKPDIVQSWMRRGAFVMGEKQSNTRPVYMGWFGGYYDTDKFTHCEHLVGVTRDITAHMVKAGMPQRRAHYIPTFPDIAAQPPVDRALFNTPREAKVLLALSRLHPKKGLDILLQSLQNLPDCVVWLAGDGPLKRELEALAKKLDVMHRVRFLGWRTDRAALLRAADACVLPSRYEPFGTVILEAWAAGTPLVAAKSAGPAAHVEDGVTGLLVPIDDVAALTEALRKVTEDGILRRALVAQGYAAYIKDYTRESVTRQWLALYNSVLK